MKESSSFDVLTTTVGVSAPLIPMRVVAGSDVGRVQRCLIYFYDCA
jgi:hypothetical protein